jgi:hypothetical protein
VTAYFAEGHASNATISSIPELSMASSATQQIKYEEEKNERKAEWRLSGTEGEYKITIDYNNEKYDHTLLISKDKKYSAPEKMIQNSKLTKIVVGYDKVYTITIFGVRFTWFWTYLILSIILSILIRKILQVY